MDEGKPYVCTSKVENVKDKAYGDKIKNTTTINKGERYPTSILKYNNPHKVLHKTQKPTDLCEYLIKTYSNKNDLVLDFCMGSGSTVIACINTGRRYIGIEKNQDIFTVAKKRISEHKIKKNIKK